MSFIPIFAGIIQPYQAFTRGFFNSLSGGMSDFGSLQFISIASVSTSFTMDYTGPGTAVWTSVSTTDGVEVETGNSVTFDSWATEEPHVVTIEVDDPLLLHGFIWNTRKITNINMSKLNGNNMGAVELNANLFSDAADCILPSANPTVSWTRLYLQQIFDSGTIDMTGLLGGMLPQRMDAGHGLEGILLPTSTRTLTGQLDWANGKIGVVDWSVMPNIIAGTSTLQLQGNDMITAVTNENLVILAATVLGKGPALASAVNISGDNSAPDAVSGGFDGLQAVADLVTEGVVVITS